MDVLKQICVAQCISDDCEWWALYWHSWLFDGAFVVVLINLTIIAIFGKRGVRPRFVDRLLKM